MPRQARESGETDYDHILMCGNNKSYRKSKVMVLHSYEEH